MIGVVSQQVWERTLLELIAAGGLSVDLPPRARCLRIHSLTDDSRAVGDGSCFVAVAGVRRNGGDYIDDAVARGAVAVISEQPVELPSQIAAIQVKDARSALARLAAAWYGFQQGGPAAHLKLIGVTGTNGKTTTCTLIRSILQRAGAPTALLGTIHYDLLATIEPAPWTTPPPLVLSERLARAVSNGATHAVMEVSSHALSQRRCDGHRFQAAVFTNLSGEHLDYHGNVEAYADAKKRLFDSLDEQGLAVVNADDPLSERMVSSCSGRILRFGVEGPGDVTADIRSLTTQGAEFDLHTPDGSVTVSWSLVGEHNIANALAAAATAVGFGIDLDAIRAGLEEAGPVAGRLQPVDTGDRGFRLFVDYAHTDDALSRVLSALKPLAAGRLICVFGCGGDRDRSKRPRMARTVADHADIAIVTSDNPRFEDPPAIIDEICSGFVRRGECAVEIETDRRRAIERAVAIAREGDIVLIAGKGHENYQIVGNRRLAFDDVEVAMCAMNDQRPDRGRPVSRQGRCVG